MKLLPDWKWILTKAWSVWAFYAVALLSFVEVVLASNGASLSKSMPAGSYAAVVGIVSAVGIWLRAVAQQKADEIAKEQSHE